MKTMPWILAGALLWAGSVWAQAPAGAPAGATGICRDGTYSTAASKSGACQGHKGVQTWYAGAAAPAATGRPAEAQAAAPAPVAKPASTTAVPAPADGRKLSPAQAAAQKPQAPGGAKGLVWVNTASNVYHCSDSPYYGRTKAGAYMSEADAKAKGAHGARGESCAGK